MVKKRVDLSTVPEMELRSGGESPGGPFASVKTNRHYQ